MKLYRVAWRSRLIGVEGRGIWWPSREAVQAWADEENAKYPDILHWVETSE